MNHSLTIKNVSGAALTNYPVQIGRPFLKGEIHDAPQVLIDGTEIASQADIKNRHDDGSVKFAILSFVIASLADSAKITFRNTIVLDNTPGASTSVDGEIRVVKGGVTQVADLGEMFEDGNYTTWTSGPIATTLILADHSSTRLYDFGFDTFKPIRPIFHVTIWHTIGRVRVRFIGELAHSEELTDITVDKLELVLNGNVVYTRNTPLTMYAASRWTKVFWDNGQPEPKVNWDWNLPYLIQTRYVPQFDASVQVLPDAITNIYDKTTYNVFSPTWPNAAKDLYDAGLWTKGMPGAGGRPDLGLTPLWHALWLYTGDWRMAEIVLKQADLAGAWSMNFREGRTDKKFDRAKTIDGLGKVLSVSTRPTIALRAGVGYPYTKLEDRVKAVGPTVNFTRTAATWFADGAHQPEPFSIPYILTGDFFYLEQMHFWASWSVAQQNGAAIKTVDGRGPTGVEGGIHDEVRGDAWVVRSRALTAFLTPDGDPEKDYFHLLTLDALAVWEGERGITGSALESLPAFTWGKYLATHFNGSRWSKYIGGALRNLGGPPPLGHWENNTGTSTYLNTGTNDIVSPGFTSNWMQNFLICSLARIKELGFPSGALLERSANCLIGQLLDPDFNPYLSAAYHVPVMKFDYTYFTTWAETKLGYPREWRDKQDWPPYSYPTNPSGYMYFVHGAAGCITHLPKGAEALAKIKSLLADKLILFQSDPRYALAAIPDVPPDPPDEQVEYQLASVKVVNGVPGEPVKTKIGSGLRMTVDADGTPVLEVIPG